jgi:hypothetical protein
VNIPLHDKIETSATSQEKGTSDSQDELRGLSLSLMSIESDASYAHPRFSSDASAIFARTTWG